MTSTQQKQLLRRSITERLAHLNAKDRAAESRSIMRRIKENMPPNSAILCGYHPMPSEPDLLPLLAELLAKGIALYLPRTEGKAFNFHRVTDLTQLERGPFGILEPKAETEELNLKTVQLALVPGVAFDASGNRLGRGNGGYDKWLAKLRKENPTAQVWGIAFDCQIVHAIPTETHDAKVDAVVTARGMQKGS